ncbi:MAG: AraC family transcriptional regulator [Aggregatilineales bacterium]
MRDQATYWRVPHFDNLEMLHAAYYEHVFQPHIHEEFSISVIDGGGNAFRHRGSEHIATPGTVIVINPQELHTGSAANELGLHYRAMYPGVILMRQIATELTGSPWGMPFFKQSIIYDPLVAGLMQRFHNIVRTEASIMAQQTALRVALGQLVARHAVNRPQVQALGDERLAVAKARDYLEEHYTENVTLETLSELTALSPFYLARVFHQQVGLPPHKYLTHIRITRAKALLTLGNSALDVALATGFTDQSHLTRHFKRIVGITPGHYARLSS